MGIIGGEEGATLGEMEKKSKKSKKKKTNDSENVVRGNEIDGRRDDAVDRKGYVEVDGALQKEKSQKHRKKKRKPEFNEEETNFTDAVPTEVKMSTNLSEEDKKTSNKKKHEHGSDNVVDGIENEAQHEKGNLEADGGLQKKKKKRKIDSAETSDGSSEKTRLDGEHKSLQTNDGPHAGNDSEQKPKKEKKKRHEEQRKKGGNSNVSCSMGILEGEKTRSDKVVEGKKSSDKEITEMNNGEEGAQEKKTKRNEKDDGDGDEKGKKNTNVGKSREDCDEGIIEKVGKKRKREKKKNDNDFDAGFQEIVAQESSKEGSDLREKDLLDGESTAQSTPTKTHDGEDKKGSKDKKKKKTKLVENGSENSRPKGKSKKVSFSGHVEVFPSTDTNAENEKNQENDLVRGKRFTLEEDEIVKQAVLNYIEAHSLGEEGLDMVLHCSSHPEIKNCWKEIGACIPYRPHTAIYYRAHILFERAEKRAWTKEEYEFVLKSQQEHGNNWKLVAEELGKHRFHVKDAYRRIKLLNMKKGRWSQAEYQNLHDLVNMDLQMKVSSEEKKSKHGMLRDNIPWSAISDKLSTRTDATCCTKWYKQLTSSMVAEGIWSDADDYRLLGALYNLDACCVEDVDWDNLIDHRTGDVCRKRWDQMVLHIGHHGMKPFAEQVEILSMRYCPDLAETRETWDTKPVVP